MQRCKLRAYYRDVRATGKVQHGFMRTDDVKRFAELLHRERYGVLQFQFAARMSELMTESYS